ANLHTDQERDYFMQRYHDVISSFGGKTSYDADNRPLLVMRSNLWASGYDVDGTDQTSLGQFSGRVQQTYKHSVPRFFVPEHGTMFTLALVRFPPTATKEIQYLNAKCALTYIDIAGDPVLYGNLPPREISMKDVFRSGDSSKKFKIAEGQWYRYAPSYVSPAYHLLENQTGKKFRVGIKSNISTNRNNLISGVDRCIHLNAMKKTTITSINRQTIKI